MKSTVQLIWVVLFLFVLVGCSGSRETGKVVQPPPSDAKVTLEELASTGDLSAHQDQLLQQLQDLGESNPEKSQELLADYKELSSLSEKTAVQEQARQMAEKL